MRLPQSAQEFVRVIGLEATLKLSELSRDRRLYIPHTIPPSHPIAQSVGGEAAEKLRRAFGGSMMPLASCKAARTSRRIALGFVQGFKVSALQEAYGVSERTVYRALTRVTTGDVKGISPGANGITRWPDGITQPPTPTPPRGRFFSA